ncbi:MAG: gamma-glutamyl-gamma-aminobutyrate hydrolase family protein [Pseudomonadota bacterium]|nr:gamma-glutamyl-gamma-aminobutyrate hydrolase family protein [Pseudomonadota bacterium]
MKELVLAYSPYTSDQAFPFDEVFTYGQDAKTVGFDNADAFVLWGGTDIHPSYYGQNHHRMNGAPASPSERDVWEWKAMQHCKANNIPIIGVCRGAQFLCAFAGGSLIQHVSGHHTSHQVVDHKGLSYSVTSSHHQMLDVHGTKHKMLAWCPAPLSLIYCGEGVDAPPHIQAQREKKKFYEPEIVFFPDVKGLAIQGHPEWAKVGDTFVKECNQYVVDLLLTNKFWR